MNMANNSMGESDPDTIPTQVRGSPRASHAVTTHEFANGPVPAIIPLSASVVFNAVFLHSTTQL